MNFMEKYEKQRKSMGIGFLTILCREFKEIQSLVSKFDAFERKVSGENGEGHAY